MKSLLIKLPNWMGDILFSYDLLFSLAQHYQQVALLTSRDHAELFRIFPIPNTVVIDYAPENWPHIDRDTVLQIQDFRADAGLLLPNSFGSAFILKLAGVSRLYGYDTEHRGLLLTGSLRKPVQRMHQTEYYLNLLRLFELPAISYPTENVEEREPLVVIHPGASKVERAWNLDRFSKVAEELTAKGKEVLFVSGERLSSIDFPVRVRPSLVEFASILRKCSLFIGNDSGPLHLAQQCGAPVIGIYGPGDPLVTGPRPISPSRTIYHGYPCSPCRQKFFKECNPAPTMKPYCIETISTQEVLNAALSLLKVSQVSEKKVAGVFH
jgi:ADP-heptose:LPS heptosyltransferase